MLDTSVCPSDGRPGLSRISIGIPPTSPINDIENNALALQRSQDRQLTVDYEKGVLRLQWAHDGETEVKYDWSKALPEDAAE